MSKIVPAHRFTKDSIPFLLKAGRQKNILWLDKNRADFERLIQKPYAHLALTIATELRELAPDYHFPLKGIGRIKRTARSASESGYLYKNWMAYNASRPAQSRFENNPNLFFLINSEDSKDPVLLAGGLYMSSSRQTRMLRAAIAEDASAFDALFADKMFKKRFPDGFSFEKQSSRPARGYAPDHPRMAWLRLQAFFVWRPYTKTEFYSAEFAQLVAQDCKQILRLNRLLENVVAGHKTLVTTPDTATAVAKGALLDRLQGLDDYKPRPADF